MPVRFNRQFVKQHDKANQKIQEAFKRRLEIFLKNPIDQQLNNHALTGNYRGYRSINITGDWRAIYTKNREEIIFVALGTHSQLYG